MKKIHRFLTHHIPPDESFALSSPEQVRQISVVLGMKPGENLILFENGGADIVVEIVGIDKETVTVKKLMSNPVTPVPRKLIAAVAITKGDTFEWVVQKLTEIGVSEIVPIISTRTVKQDVRIERLQNISNEALELCGGNQVVTIHPPIALAECQEKFQIPAVVFDTATTQVTPPVLPHELIMYLGPEGGWDNDERASFASAGVQVLSLGPRMMRTETAAVVGAYTLLWHS